LLLGKAWERYTGWLGRLQDSEIGEDQTGRVPYSDASPELIVTVSASITEVRLMLRSAADELD
jgi:hypothetical protein